MLKADAVLWGSDLTSSPQELPGMDPKVLPQSLQQPAITSKRARAPRKPWLTTHG